MDGGCRFAGWTRKVRARIGEGKKAKVGPKPRQSVKPLSGGKEGHWRRLRRWVMGQHGPHTGGYGWRAAREYPPRRRQSISESDLPLAAWVDTDTVEPLVRTVRRSHLMYENG